MITDQFNSAPGGGRSCGVEKDPARTREIARGIAKAANHLAATNRGSAFSLIDEALALCPDSLVIATSCDMSLRWFDALRLEAAANLARAHIHEFPELRIVLGELERGPLRAIALARRLSSGQQQRSATIPGRIAYVLHRSLPHAGNGYAMRSHGMAKALIKRGVDLFCVTKPGFPFDLNRHQDGRNGLATMDAVDSVEYHRITAPRQRDFSRHPCDITAHAPIQYLEHAADAFVRKFTEVRPSCVVSASNFVVALPAAIAARQLGLPFIYEVRGFWELTRDSRLPGYLQSSSGQLEVFLETAVASAADAVITLTGPMRDELMARGVPAERIILAPNACNVENFVPAPRSVALQDRLGFVSTVPVIGYAGSFTPYEGLDDLVEACGNLKSEGLDFRLLLVGGEPPDEQGAFPVTDRIRDLARRNGIQNRLIMPGAVPHDEVAQWYSLIDIAPFPRKSLPVTELVSPLKPLEAMAMEKAVVVSSVGGMCEIVRHEETGLVFAKGEVKALSGALRRLLEDADLRQKLGTAARAWVKRERDWSNAAEGLIEAISPLIVDHEADD